MSNAFRTYQRRWGVHRSCSKVGKARGPRAEQGDAAWNAAILGALWAHIVRQARTPRRTP